RPLVGPGDEIYADLPDHALNRDEYVLSRLIGGDVVDLQTQWRTLPLPNSVAIGVTPARFLEEPPCFRRIVRNRLHVIRVLPETRRDRRQARLADVSEETIRDLLPIDRQQNRPAYPHIVDRRTVGIPRDPRRSDLWGR